MRLVIAEKPSVASNIADVLGANDRKDGYREGNGYVVSWCFGHLVELKEPQEYDEAYSKWNYDSLPIIPQEFQYRAKDDTKKQFQILKDLMSDSRITEIVEATDAGREGELIFRLTYMLAHCQKPILRLWISSMEESAISDGFENLRPGEEYQDLYDSALARQQADWLVGINGTRLFTVLYKNKVLKVGRVQTPTLAMMAARELEIMNFQKKPYYTVELHVDGVKAVSARYEEKGQAEEIAAKCKNGDATVIEAIKEEKTIHPPKLYDLTSLQRDANKLFGFTAKQTLEHTQNLYEKKLVTYPRTDSQYLSDDMEQTASAVIGAIKNEIPFVKDMDEYVPELKKVLNSKKVTDHHAIIPTVEIKKEMDISDAERKVLFLIANRLLCATAQKHVYVSENVTIACAGVEFSITGKEIKDNGWKAYEEKLKEHFSLKKDASDEDEDELNPIRFTKGENVKVQEASVAEKFTKAPPRYTEDLFSKSEVWIPRRKGAG